MEPSTDDYLGMYVMFETTDGPIAVGINENGVYDMPADGLTGKDKLSRQNIVFCNHGDCHAVSRNRKTVPKQLLDFLKMFIHYDAQISKYEIAVSKDGFPIVLYSNGTPALPPSKIEWKSTGTLPFLGENEFLAEIIPTNDGVVYEILAGTPDVKDFLIADKKPAGKIRNLRVSDLGVFPDIAKFQLMNTGNGIVVFKDGNVIDVNVVHVNKKAYDSTPGRPLAYAYAPDFSEVEDDVLYDRVSSYFTDGNGELYLTPVEKHVVVPSNYAEQLAREMGSIRPDLTLKYLDKLAVKIISYDDNLVEGVAMPGTAVPVSWLARNPYDDGKIVNGIYYGILTGEGKTWTFKIMTPDGYVVVPADASGVHEKGMYRGVFRISGSGHFPNERAVIDEAVYSNEIGLSELVKHRIHTMYIPSGAKSPEDEKIVVGNGGGYVQDVVNIMNHTIIIVGNGRHNK